MVSSRTTVLLLRLRHQLTVTRATGSRLLLCEETVALALSGGDIRLSDEEARNMLDALPEWTPLPEEIADERARQLLADHRRVREASDARGSYQVTLSLPVDVMGVFVLVPA